MLYKLGSHNASVYPIRFGVANWVYFGKTITLMCNSIDGGVICSSIKAVYIKEINIFYIMILQNHREYLLKNRKSNIFRAHMLVTDLSECSGLKLKASVNFCSLNSWKLKKKLSQRVCHFECVLPWISFTLNWPNIYESELIPSLQAEFWFISLLKLQL